MSCNVNVRAAHNVAHVVTSTYDAIPEHLSLTNVVVIHRHGDRSQISREIGPNFPETSDIKEIWTSKLPVDTTMMTMAAAAHVPTDVLSLNVEKAIYTGWDEKNIPYGQLTELGAHQLMNIGRELRRRYVGSLLPLESFDASTLLYCRSTNFCRTIQSIRSLLSGLLKVDGDDYSSMRSSQQLPVILSRAKKDETMFPGADGPCSAMTERRAEIFAESLMESSIPNYSELEQKMRDVLGYGDRVSWLPIKEILTCYEAHGIKFPEGAKRSCVQSAPMNFCTTNVHLVCLGITDSDADRVTDLAGWMWGTMYNDDALNRLAIGRFLRELLDVVHSAVFNLPTPPPSSSFSFLPSTPLRTSSLELEEHAKMMIFSGHDSTLVPVLCALGIYDGKNSSLICPMQSHYPLRHYEQIFRRCVAPLRILLKHRNC